MFNKKNALFYFQREVNNFENELPPPPEEPVVETAWERGLRHAKEVSPYHSQKSVYRDQCMSGNEISKSCVTIMLVMGYIV